MVLEELSTDVQFCNFVVSTTLFITFVPLNIEKLKIFLAKILPFFTAPYFRPPYDIYE